MNPIRTVCSPTVVLPTHNIDTDQIIPARFLTTTKRSGLGRHAFHHWRYDDSGNPHPDFPLNQPHNQRCTILVGGDNFGCGSSREHAPWSLLDLGIEVVISSQIADIFRTNALKNGLLPVVVDRDTHAWLLDNPGVEISVDVSDRSVSLPGRPKISFELDDFSQHCLLNGLDQLGFILEHEEQIQRFEESRQ